MNAVLKYGKQLFTSYAVTIFVTVFGTLLGLLIMSMYAYAMSRKDFRLSKFLAIFLLIPMLFNGGQLSGYIVFTSLYHLKDSLLLLILPLCVSTMNVIILRTYIVNSIPSELMEAAKIDGAGEYRILWSIVLPLSKPVIATVFLYYLVDRWNEWYNAMIMVRDTQNTPLQLVLRNIVLDSQNLDNIMTESVELFTFSAGIAYHSILRTSRGMARIVWRSV